MCANIRNHTHKYLGMATINRDSARALWMLLGQLEHRNLLILATVNREYFVVKIFLDSLAYAKIKHAKYMRIIISNAVRGRLSKNYLTQKFIAQNIFGTKYSRFMVFCIFGSPIALISNVGLMIADLLIGQFKIQYTAMPI